MVAGTYINRQRSEAPRKALTVWAGMYTHLDDPSRGRRDVMCEGQVTRSTNKNDDIGHLVILAADLEIVPWVQARLNAPLGCRPAVQVKFSPREWGHIVVGAGWFWWLLPYWPIRPTADVRAAAKKITAILERLDERLKP